MSSRETETAVAGALTRASVYRLLGRAFAYPTPAVVEELAALAAQLGSAPGVPPDLAALLTGLAASATGAEAAALADEHVFLFHRQVQCSPYEGAYGPSDPFAAGKSAALADIAGFYAAFGLDPAAGEPDVQDHIGAELEFMSVLALKEAYARAEAQEDALAVTRDAEARFLTDHLGRWAETFAEGVRAATPVPYFGAAADLLGAWIRRDVAALSATPSRVLVLATRGPAEEDVLSCPMAGGDEPSPGGDGNG